MGVVVSSLNLSDGITQAALRGRTRNPAFTLSPYRHTALENPPGMSANVVLIDQDIACFRDAKAASPFKVSLELLSFSGCRTC